ncbi:P-loop containing nucleoside triphosphate hydrolase protein [Syncephalis fuscata]|nr:P-loop containing nucleoside triphosphate hydrolase protein [Syncephalis fuscata]
MSRSLTVVFTTLRTCFVNLPPSWSSALLDQTKHVGQVVLEVSWSNIATPPTATKEVGASTFTNRTFLAWAGGSSQVTTSGNNVDILEIDGQFGHAVGLESGQTVNVKFQRKVTMAHTIQLEPYSPDDWEIMELHAGYFEEQLLNQVGVVYQNQLLTVWVQQRTLIRLRVVSTDPDEPCVRLGVDVEVHIAPKVRQLIAPNTTQNTKPIPRRIYPRLISREGLGIGHVSPSTLYIHPDTLPCLSDEESESTRHSAHWISGQLLCVTTVRLNSKSKDTMAGSNDDSESTIALLQIDQRIPPGMALGGELIWSSLKLNGCQRVKVMLMEHKPVPSTLVSFQLIDQSSSSTPPIGHEMATKALLEWILEHTNDSTSIVWVDGMILTCSRLEHEDPVYILVRIKASEEDKKTDEPSTSGNTAVSLLPSFVVMNMKEWREVKVTETTHDPSLVVSKERSVPILGGLDKWLEQIYLFIRCSLVAPALESSMGTTVNGGLLVCGREGSGKSVVLDYLEHRTSKDVGLFAHWVRVDCNELSKNRMAVISDQLQQHFDEAAWHAPSIVCFDNLDRLCPAELEVACHCRCTRARQLAERLLEIVRRMLAQHQSFIQLVTTLTPPDKRQRYEILKCLQQVKHMTLNHSGSSMMQVDLQQVASETEGYVASDLATLLDQAMQQAVIRSLSTTQSVTPNNTNQLETTSSSDKTTNESLQKDEQQQQQQETTTIIGDTSETNSLQLTMTDFTTAMANYTPSSLRGVKLATVSSVAWSDIGGLHEARKMLLETLEWPTKYARIFANCPLRLRSGLLLYGYPGCGKTLLASAVAKECGLNFISVKGPELLNKYIGASEKSVRDLFERARAARPAILFFDEFDSIAPRRGHDSTGVTDRVVNQMLTEMDGAEQLEGVYVLAATSRPDLIDPALLRPGRLDKSILCGMPNHIERQEASINLLGIYSKVLITGLCHVDIEGSGSETALGRERGHEVIEQKTENLTNEDSNDESMPSAALQFLVSNRQQMTAAEHGLLSQRATIQQAQLTKDGISTNTKSRKSTAPKVNPIERQRLTRIYDEFVDARGGELSDGTGTKGVGQRVTLG